MDKSPLGSFDLSTKVLTIVQGLSQGEYALNFNLKRKDASGNGSDNSTGTVMFSVEQTTYILYNTLIK